MDQKSKSKTTVFVAMSGGVDSSVSAALLKEEGYNIVGVYMKNWSGEDYGIQFECPWEEEQKMVEDVCKKLNIPFRTFNFEKEYRDKVVEYFFREYEAGRTPNPDVMCNKEIKFGIFLDKAESLGAELIATGHYARVIEGKDKKSHLLKGVDENKDQTYFLNEVTQEQLSKTLFPIGHLQKPEVRELAKKFGLPNAEKKDSQGICFIGDIDVREFLRTRLKKQKGSIIDVDSGKVVGEHEGAAFYTIGQREGLNIGGAAEPYFVAGKDVNKNEVYVAMGKTNPALFKQKIVISNLNWINEPSKENVEVSIRYRQKPQPAKIKLQKDTAEIEFLQPIRAVTEGQSAVVYSGDECFGGGIIEEIS
jgi:tRNA-uridine 2-sulfurtransferase